MELTECETFFAPFNCIDQGEPQDDVCNYCQNDERFTPEDYNRVR